MKVLEIKCFRSLVGVTRMKRIRKKGARKSWNVRKNWQVEWIRKRKYGDGGDTLNQCMSSIWLNLW